MHSFASTLGLSATAALLLLVPADETRARGEDRTHASSVAWGDFDHDGRPDAYVANLVEGDRLFRGLGEGAFEEVELPTAEAGELRSRFALWRDVDADGLPDLYVSGASAPGRLFRNAGHALFEELPLPAMQGVVVSASFLDLDADGAPDLEIEGSASSVLLRNAGRGGFVAVDLPLPARLVALPPVALPPGVQPGDEAELPRGGATAAGGRDRAPDDAQRVGGGTQGSSGRQNAALAGMVNSSQFVGGLALAGPADCLDRISDVATGNCLQASSAPALGLLYPLSTALNLDGTGRVGMGTTSPTHGLHVATSIRAQAQVLAGYGSAAAPGFRFGDGSEATGLASPSPNTIAMIANGAERARLTADGKLGLGTVAPSHTLHVAGDVRATNQVLAGFGSSAVPSIRFGDGTETSGLSSPAGDTVSVLTTGVERIRIDSAGRVGIGTGSPGARLDVFSNDATGTIPLVLRQGHATSNILTAINGSGTVFQVKNSGRVVTTALQITGGGDLVEGFDASEGACEPGTVVSIDPENPGKLVSSAASYDRRVAGVVSGANGVDHGIRMGQDGVLDGDTLVAMSGRVWVKCSAENGAVEPGDLLTSASLEGHAMKATDAARGFGAVIGKAMSRLERGTGLVLVLVNLQ